MKRALLFFIAFCLTLSCDRYPDPYLDLLKDYSFAFTNNQGMRYLAGEWVSETIRFQAIDNKNPRKDSIRVVFEVAKGGGEITVSSGYTDTSGYITTGWKLGTETFKQILRANTYDLSGNFLNSSDFIAYGFRTNEWDTLTDAYEARISSLAADTVNKITLMINSGNLYRQGERYYIWNIVNGPKLSSLRTVNIDQDGVFYVCTFGGDFLRSTDHGISWESCTRPYSETTYNIHVQISNDNYIWVSAYDRNALYSKDQGLTWEDAGIDFPYWGYGDIFRLKDGSLVSQGSDCCSLSRSFDEGVTWSSIPVAGYLNKLYVTDKDEIIICVNPFMLYKSTDYGTTFSPLYGVNPEWGSSMENIFNKVNNFYYILAPGWGILKSKDFSQIDIYWINFNLRELYIDHNGVMIGKYWSWQWPYDNIVYYRNNSN